MQSKRTISPTLSLVGEERWLSRSLVLLAVLLVAVGRADAARLSAWGVRGFPGITVSVPIDFQGATTIPSNVVALQADILFDAGSLMPMPATRGNVLRMNHVLNSSSPATGVRRILIYSLNNTAISNGILANLVFTVSTAARSSHLPLTLTNVILSTAAAAPVNTTNTSGYISVGPVYPRDDHDVDVFLNGVSGQTYIIQASTDLRSWVNILTNLATAGIIQFTDTDAHNYSQRFYRAVLFNSLTSVRIGTVTLLGNGTVSFSFDANVGTSYVVQASTNLVNWANLSTNVAAGSVVSFSDSSATNFPYRFYRIKLGP